MDAPSTRRAEVRAGEILPGARPVPASSGEAHRYGPRVHLHGDPWLHLLLARLASPESVPPLLHALLREAYRLLLARAAARELARAPARLATRMAEHHPDLAIWEGAVPDASRPLVVVDVVRAGLIPAQLVFELLTLVLPWDRVRLDHLQLARVADERGRVSGVDLSGSKIGGSIEGATLIVPDPMGATGSTVERVLGHYRAHHGRPAKVVLLPLITTPEFLRKVLALGEEVVVHAGRVDRGLSAPDVRATLPGTRWDEERGLDERGYIVPGAGGMGEVLSNSWC